MLFVNYLLKQTSHTLPLLLILLSTTGSLNASTGISSRQASPYLPTPTCQNHIGPMRSLLRLYLINRQPTPVLHMDTPIHNLFGTHPKYNKTRVFGSLCFPWLRPYTSHKLEDRSTLCVFIGYSQTQSAYLYLQHNTCRIYVSRHVRFDKYVFPFKTSTLPHQCP